MCDEHNNRLCPENDNKECSSVYIYIYFMKTCMYEPISYLEKKKRLPNFMKDILFINKYIKVHIILFQTSAL